jgi:hypothetical protein
MIPLIGSQIFEHISLQFETYLTLPSPQYRQPIIFIGNRDWRGIIFLHHIL